MVFPLAWDCPGRVDSAVIRREGAEQQQQVPTTRMATVIKCRLKA